MPSATSDTPSETPVHNAPGDSQASAAPGVIVLRVSEIFLKGRNRRMFWNAFVRNARRLLQDVPGADVESSYMRVAVYHPAGAQRACIERLERLFGMASMSPAAAVPPDIAAIEEAAVAAASARPASQSFKVETKRRDKSFPMPSPDISRHIGGRVAARTGRPVNVRAPEQIIHIEVGEQSYIFSEVLPGPGGLPVGTSGKAALLLSGGIDSPVAGWYAMRRGCLTSAVYFHSFPYTGDKTKEKVLDLARILGRYQGGMTVHVVPFTEAQKTLRDHGRADFAVLLYRRMMMRVASRIAGERGAKALVTGENLGQVASQTLENLAVIEDAADLPVLRPLIGFNKEEIVMKAQRIGTFETSILPYDDCCSLFVPKHPATRARISDLEAAEAGLDVAAMADALAAATEHIRV